MLPQERTTEAHPKNEACLQVRISEVHCERLAEEAARRLAREAKAASRKDPAVALAGRSPAPESWFPLSRPI